MEVISSIGAETVVNMSHVGDLIIDRSLKLNKKDVTEDINVLDMMVAPQFVLYDRTMPIYSRNILNFDTSIIEDDAVDGFISVQSIFNSMSDMCSFGFIIPTTQKHNYIADPLNGSSITNFENINYEYHSYDEYLRFLKGVSMSDNEILPFYGMDTIAEGETKAVSGARIQETDYIVNAFKQNDNITLSLTPGDFYTIVDGDEMRPRIVFFKNITVQKVNTEYSNINLNGTTLDFAPCKNWKQLSLGNVNKFINKYDSENDIFYSLIATTNNENVPEELRYSIIVYINYSASGGLPDESVPYDVWYSENDSNGVDIYSFNFDFNDNIDDFTDYISSANVWSDANEDGKSFSYVFTSANKEGYKFIKDSVGMITYEPFDFSTTKEYIAATSFVKKDSYSLYKSEIAKKSQIKIEGNLPKEDCVIFVNDKGEPSFITIQELKTKLGIS